MHDNKTNDMGFEPGTDMDADAGKKPFPYELVRTDIGEMYCKWVRDASWYAAAGQRNFFEVSYLMSGLCGEAGEASDEWKKMQRTMEFLSTPTGNFDIVGMKSFEISYAERLVKLADEVGDVLWYIAALCNMWGISLDELMLWNMAKLEMKHKGNTKKGQQMPQWPIPHGITPEEIRLMVVKKIHNAMFNHVPSPVQYAKEIQDVG